MLGQTAKQWKHFFESLCLVNFIYSCTTVLIIYILVLVWLGGSIVHHPLLHLFAMYIFNIYIYIFIYKYHVNKTWSKTVDVGSLAGDLARLVTWDEGRRVFMHWDGR